MRGYFDGDGTISNLRKKQKQFSIIGNYDFVKKFGNLE